MYNDYYPYSNFPYPYPADQPRYDPSFTEPFNESYNPFINQLNNDSDFNLRSNGSTPLRDYGPQPFTVNIDEAAKQNNTFRTALWTGKHLQVTLMSINVGDDIGLEIHPDTDQFLRIEEGQGLVRMGKNKDRLDFQARVSDNFAIMVPAGTWHNLINTGNRPIKLYSIYAPPKHPFGTVHETKAEAQVSERKSYY
jgi:mannose-6-phosphate isomerase-like protein (cupin superfamily)